MFTRGLLVGANLLPVNKCGESGLSGITPRCLHAINRGVRDQEAQIYENKPIRGFRGSMVNFDSQEITLGYKLKSERENWSKNAKCTL